MKLYEALAKFTVFLYLLRLGVSFLCFFFRKYRYVAYRQLVRWCWGWLGKDIRVQTPACAHGRIMDEYPDEGGQYRGTDLRPLVVD